MYEACFVWALIGPFTMEMREDVTKILTKRRERGEDREAKHQRWLNERDTVVVS